MAESNPSVGQYELVKKISISNLQPFVYEAIHKEDKK